MRASIITIIFSSLIFFNTAAQKTAGGIKEAANNIKKADKIFKQILPDFNEALQLFLKANELDTKNPSLNFKIGLCYFNIRDEIKAIPYLKKAVSDPENPEAHYLLARAYQFNYEFDNAKKEYGIYYSQLSKRKELNVRKMTRIVAKVVREDRVLSFSSKVKVEKLRYLVSQRITECKTAKKLFLNPVDVKIENLGVNVNSADPEYGPVISADEAVMYFTSRRANTTGGGKDPNDGKYFEDVYVTINFNGKWLEASPVGPPLCSESHESVVGLSADGQKLFLFNDVNADGGDLYISKIDGYEWPPADPLPDGINSSHAEKSVTLSADERYLFFVSDRPGGVGGKDIYWCKKKDLKWTKPRLAGKINTIYDEDGVFFHPDGKTLYFSSKGQRGMGGYDIFESTFSGRSFSKPKNLGYPINTPYDDVYFVLSASGEHGYYASSRGDGQGDNDIYVIKFPKPTKNLTILKGIISDEQTHEPLEAEIQIVDNDSSVVIGTLTSNTKTGQYLISLPSGRNYGIAVKRDGYLFHSENFNLPASMAYQEVEKNIKLKKIEIGKKIVLRNIFFDYDKAILRETSVLELERLYNLLIKYPDLKIEIAGHTDNRGGEEYNLKLSEDRAQTVVDHLIKKGISKERLRAAGYGSTKPIAPNENPDGSDNEEGRQLNRRTEFEILEK